MEGAECAAEEERRPPAPAAPRCTAKPPLVHSPAGLPRRPRARAPPSRTLAPLEAHPLGPGRAGRLGEVEDDRVLYVGQVLAGQPHGRGREYLKARTRAALQWQGVRSKLRSLAALQACACATSPNRLCP